MKATAYLLAVAIFVIDQIAKWWILSVLVLPALGTVPLLPILSLTYVENRGVSMGLLTAGSGIERWALVGITALIATIVALWIRREQRWPEALALGLVLGGAAGNIVDRVRYGHVVDFIHVHAGQWSFYVFNVADAAITIGVAVLLVRALIVRPGTSAREG